MLQKNKSGWDPVWEKIYRTRNWGQYPIEELVRFIARNFYQAKLRKKVKILEIGCGTGANVWYLAKEGFDTYGIDASETAVKLSQKKLRKEHLNANLVPGLVDKLPWPNEFFDCVIDVECLTCNSEEDSQKIINDIYRVLKTDGKHFSILAKKGCWGDKTGKKIDKTTYYSVKEGPYSCSGKTRFASLPSLKSLYKEFKNLKIEYVIRTENNRGEKIQQWLVEAQK